MDRLEYIMWRDTIRYKYQLDKSLQLSEQEIEEKIDELERTMSESMPYFFEGKDSYEIRTDVDHNIGHRSLNNTFVVIAEDYNDWQCDCDDYDKPKFMDDALLFCGDISFFASEIIRKNRRIGIYIGEQEKEALYSKQRNSSEDLTLLRRTPLRKYSEIIKTVRQLDCFDDIDFTNFNDVKAFFREQHIFTFKEFSEQNGYEFKPGHRGIFFLSNGTKVMRFGYEQNSFGYSEKNDEDLFDE